MNHVLQKIYSKVSPTIPSNCLFLMVLIEDLTNVSFIMEHRNVQSSFLLPFWHRVGRVDVSVGLEP